MPDVITANRLADGVVVFQTEDDGWTDWEGNLRRDREEERLTTLGMGLMIHDIGQVVVPDAILHKRGLLTAQELHIVRTHTDVGASLAAAPTRLPIRWKSRAS